MMSHWQQGAAAVALGLGLALGCFGSGCGGGDAPAAKAADAGTRKGSPSKDAGAGTPDAGAADAADDVVLPKETFSEFEFAESERSRDPFRSFEEEFVEKTRARAKSQREVVLDSYALEELKLIGIVLGANPPVAMLKDPRGKGHTVQRGQFVGRAEVVESSSQGGAAYELNWRVQAIRDGDVVFVREDPQNPDVPAATKVIPLRPEGEQGFTAEELESARER